MRNATRGTWAVMILGCVAYFHVSLSGIGCAERHAWGQQPADTADHGITDGQATALRLAIESRRALPTRPQRGLLLAVEAVKAAQSTGRGVPPQVSEALIHALSATGGRVLIAPPQPPAGSGEDNITEAPPPAPEPVVDDRTPAAAKTPREPSRFAPDDASTRPLPPADANSLQAVATLSCLDPPESVPNVVPRLDLLAMDDQGRWAAACHREPYYEGPVPLAPSGVVYLWDLSQPAHDALPQLLPAAPQQAMALAIRGDGAWIVAGGDDGQARLWRLQDPVATTPDVILGTEGLVADRDSRPQDPAAPADRDARTDAAAGPDVNRFTPAVTGAAFSPDSRWLVVAWQDGRVRLWKMTDQGPQDPPLPIAEGPLQLGDPILQFSPDGVWLAVANADRGGGLFSGLGAAMGNAFGGVLGALLGGTDDSPEAVAKREALQKQLAEAERSFVLFRLKADDILASRTNVSVGEDPVCRVLIGPTSRRIAACTTLGDIAVWSLLPDGPAGEPRHLEQKGQWFLGGVSVQALAFGAQGQWLISAGKHDVRLWDLERESAPDQPTATIGRFAAADSLVTDPHGDWLAFASSDGTHISLYDFTLLRAALGGQHEFLTLEPGIGIYEGETEVGAVAMQPGMELGVMILRGHSGRILGLARSPDGHRLLSASADGTLRLWHANRAAPFAQPRCLPFSPTIVEPAIAPDGHITAVATYEQVPAASGDPAGAVQIWSLPSNSLTTPLAELQVEDRLMLMLAIDPVRRWLVTQTGEGVTQLWDLRRKDPHATGIVLEGHQDRIGLASFSPNGRWLATTAGPFAMVPPPPAEGVDEASPALAPDEPRAGDPAVHLWDLNARSPGKFSIVLQGHDRPVTAMLLSPDNRWLVTAACNVSQLPSPQEREQVNRNDAAICLWNLNAASVPESRTVLLKAETNIQLVQLSPGGQFLVAADDVGQLYVWNLQTPAPSASQRSFRGHESQATALAFGLNGRRLVTGNGATLNGAVGLRPGTVRMWDLSAVNPLDTCVELAGHTGSITSIAVSADDRWVVTADSTVSDVSGTARVRLWDLQAADPTEAGRSLRAHEDTSIDQMVISPDSRYLVTSGMTETALMLWDLQAADPAASGVSLVDRRMPGEMVAMSIMFTPDGRSLQTVGIDGVRTWSLDVQELLRLARETAGRELTLEERLRYAIPAPSGTVTR